MTNLIATVSVAFAICGTVSASDALDSQATMDPLDVCNVVWDSPSTNQKGFMPIGNGDLGMNVWVEPSGDLVLLLSKTNAWSEQAEQLKLGRVRISLTPNPLKGGAFFKQSLLLPVPSPAAGGDCDHGR